MSRSPYRVLCWGAACSCAMLACGSGQTAPVAAVPVYPVQTSPRAATLASAADPVPVPATPPFTRALVKPPPGFAEAPLGMAKVAYAKALNAMHNRIHPLFSDVLLPSLQALPPTDARNGASRSVALAIVLASDGHVVAVDVTRSSGVDAFDQGALRAVQAAAPFGPMQPETLSGDGNFYVGWTFHRDEMYACSTANAVPYRFVAKPAQP